MIAPATSAPVEKMASWIRIRRVRCMLRPVIQVVGNDKGIPRRVRAGQLSDGAAPLHLQFGEVSLPTSTGEERGVEPTQGQIDDRGEIRVVTTEPVRQLF